MAPPNSTTQGRIRLGPSSLVFGGAWLPVAIAVTLAALQGIHWAAVVRLVVTALVYTPVAAIVLTRRHLAIATIVGTLAISSGWLALVIVLRDLPGAQSAIDPLFEPLVLFARQCEIAALSILPWLLATTRPHIRLSGITFGFTAIVIDVGLWAFTVTGHQVSRELLLLPLLLAVLSFLAAAVPLADRWRRGGAGDREALTWFGLGVIFLILSYLRLVVPMSDTLAAFADVAFVLAQGLLPTAILAIVLGGEAIGSDRRLTEGIVWLQALALAIAMYLAVDEFARLLGLSAAVAGAFAAGVLVLAFSATLRFVRQRTTRLYFGPGVDAREVLGRLGERLAVSGTNGAGVRELAESLKEIWDLASVTIIATTTDNTVRSGDRGPAMIATELIVGRRSAGRIELTGDDDTRLQTTVAPVLQQVATLIGVAVLLADVNQEVAATRQRTLGIRREERRMLHRELHEELAPSLAGISFALTAAQRLVASGEPAATTAIGELRCQVADRVEGVRQLARTLLPAALDAGDLDGALAEVARRFNDEGAVVAVRAAGSDVLEAGVQVAVYLTVVEAVSGFLRRGGVDRIEVDIVVALEQVTARIAGRLYGIGDHHEMPQVIDAIRRRAADVRGVVTESRREGRQHLEVVIPR